MVKSRATDRLRSSLAVILPISMAALGASGCSTARQQVRVVSEPSGLPVRVQPADRSRAPMSGQTPADFSLDYVDGRPAGAMATVFGFLGAGLSAGAIVSAEHYDDDSQWFSQNPSLLLGIGAGVCWLLAIISGAAYAETVEDTTFVLTRPDGTKETRFVQLPAEDGRVLFPLPDALDWRTGTSTAARVDRRR